MAAGGYGFRHLAHVAIGALCCVAACGRIWYEQPPVDTDASGVDGGARDASDRTDGPATADAGMTCAWTGPPSFTDIAPIADLNDPDYQADPHLSPDGTILYFNDSRFGSSDLLASLRTGPTSFEPPTQVPGLSHPSDGESGFDFIDESLLRVVISIARSGNVDIFTAERASTTEAFGNITPVAAVNSADADYDPVIHPVSGDLFFASYRSGGPGAQNIYRAPRVGGGWGAPELVSALASSGSNTSGLVFTRDGRFGLYQGPGGDIYFTEHLGGSSFASPVALPSLAGAAEPFIAANGCEVFFVRSVTDRHWEMFRARVLP